MTLETKTAWDKWWTLLIAVAFAGSAWIMASWQWVYPPIPMFIAAVMGGWLFRGRPQSAARASLWVGFLWSWIAEWAYFSVRLNDSNGIWAKTEVLERFGLGIAEITLYTALLSFFTAFIAWGSDQAKATAMEPVAEAGSTQTLAKLEVPFQPEETEKPNPIPMITIPRRTASREVEPSDDSKKA